MLESKDIEGPPIYMNWLAMLKGNELISTHEYPLYSDAHVTGEIDFGPYQFLHAVPIPVAGMVQPTIILRYDSYWAWRNPSWAKTDAERYHGGTPAQEIAALASLAVGVRFKAGDATRDFHPGDDPKGRPRATATRPLPVLTIGNLHRWVLPRIIHGQRPLTLLQPVSILPNMNALDAITLVRAARLYQDALWLAESEPEFAWLLMVSALETAAVRWDSHAEAPITKLQTSKPDFFAYLSNLRDKAILSRVAEEMKNSLGVMRKFLNFIKEFRPPEPKDRPTWWKIDWSDKELEKALKIVYDYRSKALHTGQPFPGPMCQPPPRLAGWITWAEKPGGDVGMGGGFWKEKDLPIYLHTFEYITRGTLLNWWASLNKR